MINGKLKKVPCPIKAIQNISTNHTHSHPKNRILPKENHLICRSIKAENNFLLMFILSIF
jgi:hypothetical protein